MRFRNAKQDVQFILSWFQGAFSSPSFELFSSFVIGIIQLGKEGHTSSMVRSLARSFLARSLSSFTRFLGKNAWAVDEVLALALQKFFQTLKIGARSIGFLLLDILGKVNVDSSVTGNYQRTEFMQVEDFSSRTTLSAATSTPAPTATVPVLVGDLISNVQISNDAENVILSFDYASGQYNAFQLFVDTDQNPNTGFAINGIGAETLFENQTWNIYDGSGTVWKWQPTEVLISFDDSNNRAQLEHLTDHLEIVPTGCSLPTRRHQLGRNLHDSKNNVHHPITFKPGT